MKLRALAALMLLLATTDLECGDRVAALARPLEPPQKTSQSGGSATALQTFPAGGPSTTNNNDSCDIALLPAATLLLPYFEIDLIHTNGETTLFTVTNVSGEERIAHVTLWTDHAWPVLDFNLRLTGYDVQSINLADVLTGNLVQNCDGQPLTIPPAILTQVRDTLARSGVRPPDGSINRCSEIAPNLGRAIGYVTIDVVEACTSLRPSEAAYYDTIAFDNVLIGDYQQVNRAAESAQGGPLVHIRAVPASMGTVNLPQTFYGRYLGTADPKRDRRQPLPATFATRWINDLDMDTSIKVWRNAFDTPLTCEVMVCGYRGPEVITFDEHENAVGRGPNEGPASCTITVPLDFPTDATFRSQIDHGVFPEFDDVNVRAGWLYLDLSHQETLRQGWVTATMRSGGRFSLDVDALALGNGCSPLTPRTEIDPAGTGTLGPAPNVTP